MNTENNKLIAEFLGWKVENGIWINNNGVFIQYAYQSLKFHKDWNLLMEVVEKIEGLQFQNNNDVFKVVIDYGMCIIYNMINDLEVIVNVSKSTKIEAVCSACVEFIKWFNQNSVSF